MEILNTLKLLVQEYYFWFFIGMTILFISMFIKTIKEKAVGSAIVISIILIALAGFAMFAFGNFNCFLNQQKYLTNNCKINKSADCLDFINYHDQYFCHKSYPF